MVRVTFWKDREMARRVRGTNELKALDYDETVGHETSTSRRVWGIRGVRHRIEARVQTRGLRVGTFR